jgi:H+-transporting ATPase
MKTNQQNHIGKAGIESTSTGNHNLVYDSPQDALKQLNTNAEMGLSDSEAASRIKAHGYNEVPPKTENQILKFLSKFWGLSAWMLEMIIILSAILGNFNDVIVVSVLLLVNAVISFIQEKHTSSVLNSLRRKLQVNTRVLRSGIWRQMTARELVPGDIIRVRMGDLAPADALLLNG